MLGIERLDGVELFDAPQSSAVWTSAACSRSRRPSSLSASRSAVVLGLADRLGDLVGLAVELVDLGLLGLALALQLDEPVDVDLDAAVGAVLLDQFGVFDDEFAVEHGDGGRGLVWG